MQKISTATISSPTLANINSFAGKYKLLDVPAIFCAVYLPFLIILFLVWRVLSGLGVILFYALIAGVVGRELNNFIHIFYKKDRPFRVKDIVVLIRRPKNLSCPSGHASFLFSIAFFYFFYNVPLAVILLLLTIIVGIARIFCGVHWWTDILASAGVGMVASSIIYWMVYSLK